MLQVDDPMTTSTGKHVWYVVVGDAHGLAKWEEDIGKLSYCFEKMVIKEYRGEAYLSTAANTG